MMNAVVCVLLISSLGGLLVPPARGTSWESSLRGDRRQSHERRYAESTIASDMSKIVDSMLQKNFVKFLLTQRDKKSKSADTSEELDSPFLWNLLQERLGQLVHSKGKSL